MTIKSAGTGYHTKDSIPDLKQGKLTPLNSPRVPRIGRYGKVQGEEDFTYLLELVPQRSYFLTG
jgi:hypothetical protein